MARLHWPALLIACTALTSAACADEQPVAEEDLPVVDADTPAPPPAEPTRSAAPSDAEPPPEPTVDDPGPAVAEPPELSRGAPQRIAARHLLVSFSGSVGADPSLRRTRAEALRMTTDLRSRVEAGEDLGELAKKHSDGPSAGRNGSLGAFGRGRMHPSFEKAAFALKVGEASDIVETPFGFHLIERQPLVEARLGHVLVHWEGTPRSTTTRTKEEAHAIATEAHRRLVGGEPLASVAAELSDGGSGPRGGEVGWFQRGHVQPQFAPVFELKRGGVSGVKETVYGYHILVRLE